MPTENAGIQTHRCKGWCCYDNHLPVLAHKAAVVNLAHRNDDEFIIDLAAQGIAYVPFFPLGGFSPLQSSVARRSGIHYGLRLWRLALAWLLLQRSPTILLIPGTSSVKHLRENLNAATLHLPSEMIADLDSIGGGAQQRF